MKKLKKAFWSIAAGLLLFIPIVLMEKRAASTADDAATAADDSLSYAVSLIIARDLPRAIEELAISDEDLSAFVKGLADAFPADGSPSSVAYAHGVVIGATAMEMLEDAERAIAHSDTTKKVNKQMFLEGLKATATGEGLKMTLQQAYDYYNGVVFRHPSEEFIARNRTRNGVMTLPCGVQVKIERLGDGETATLGSTVGYIYKASYINGNTVESSRGEVVEAVVGSLLPGLAEVVTTLPVGTKCKVYLPWQLAYGERGSNKVPPYSALVYDIEIVKIVK